MGDTKEIFINVKGKRPDEASPGLAVCAPVSLFFGLALKRLQRSPRPLGNTGEGTGVSRVSQLHNACLLQTLEITLLTVPYH